MKKILEVDHISKTYRGGNRPAVHSSNFSVEEGELLSLVGESGSGKTTLLRLLAGLEIPDEGTITLDGTIISAPGLVVPPEKRDIGMVFQHHALFPHLTVGRNIAFGIRHLPRAERRELTMALLELVGLPGFEKRFPHQLSGGERQRVALARALAPKPKLLLLDEPFSSLDARLRHSLRDETRVVLKRHGTTAIFVTHDTADALTIADRIVALRDGTIQQSGSPTAIYGAPGNAYVASFFGMCNFIPAGRLPDDGHIGPEPASAGLWIRPERLAIGPKEDGALKGLVRTVSFRGTHAEVVLDCICPVRGPFAVTVHHSGDGVVVGEERGVVVRNAE